MQLSPRPSRLIALLSMMLGIMLFSSVVVAHGVEGEKQSDIIFAAIERSYVKITQDASYRYIHSNGIPEHQTGEFPNRSNPNRISAQGHRYRLPMQPTMSGRVIELGRQPFGIGVNGVPFDPGTAECYGKARGGAPGPCEWREEAIVNGEGRLGLDGSNAHVQPTGAYHYHGIPYGFLELQGSADMVMVGFAADGFKMYVSRSGAYASSYQLKQGTRPSGPGGAYDGTYTADFQYVAGSGDLDECNGTEVSGNYAYILTDTFPFVPRCWVGTPDASFERSGPPQHGQGREGRHGGRQGGRSGKHHPPPRRYMRGL